MIETKYEYFNNLSKHFVGCKNPFFVVFVLIWHFNGTSSHFNSIAHPDIIEKLHRLLLGSGCSHKYPIAFFILYDAFVHIHFALLK